jgi:anti-sigma B factor antagonist
MAATGQTDLPDVLVSGLRIVVRVQGTTTTLAPEGEWDLAQKQAMLGTIRAAFERHPECVVLDLSGLRFIDSSGVHVVIELRKRSMLQNTRLVIVPGPRAVQRLFELCQLTNVLPFLDGVSREVSRETP